MSYRIGQESQPTLASANALENKPVNGKENQDRSKRAKDLEFEPQGGNGSGDRREQPAVVDAVMDGLDRKRIVGQVTTLAEMTPVTENCTSRAKYDQRNDNEDWKEAFHTRIAFRVGDAATPLPADALSIAILRSTVFLLGDLGMNWNVLFLI